jgi:hypothetical protein
MGIFTKKLHILKTGGTEETCNIYTTAEEVGGSPYLALEVDGTKGYVKLGSTTDANATHLRVEKNGTTYAAWKEAVTYVNVTITQSANQTIHVYTPQKNGGTDHTSSFVIPKGTTYEAEVIAADGYTAGTLNVNAVGVINSNMTFSASGASITIPTGRMELDYNTVDFTVPAGITVLYMYNRYLSAYVGVTPNTKHKLYYDENYRDDVDGETYTLDVVCESHGYITGTMEEIGGGNTPGSITIEWSPSINTHPVDIKHYES